MHIFNDPLRMPKTGETPEERLIKTVPLVGTPGQFYIERRGVALDIADAAGVRYDPDFSGRPAVVIPLWDSRNNLVSLHGRYLHTVHGQNKMLTIGRGGGTINMLGGWRAEPLILVEGLFDALSLAFCGWASVATIGRWAPWLSEVAAGRVVWLAFDASRPGESEVSLYTKRLREAVLRRLLPPTPCKDWSTALAKRGRLMVTQWVRDNLATNNLAPTLPR